MLIGRDTNYDERISIDGLPDFTYARAEGEPEDDWREGLFITVGFKMSQAVLRAL